MRASASTAMIASGEASRTARKRDSLSSRADSAVSRAAMRALMSTTVAKTWGPSAVSTGAQADLDGELRAVLAAAGQVEADADGSGDRMGEEAVAMPDVTVGDLVRQEQLDQVPEQLAPRIAEGGFGLGVDVGDAGLCVDREDRVR